MGASDAILRAMNAERLYVVAQAVRKDLQKTETVALLQQLRDALQQQVNQPQQPAPQQQVANLRTRLVEALGRAATNSFNPMWRQIVTELALDGWLGTALAERIESVFSRNQITPAAALQEMVKLLDELSKKNAAINSLTDAFSFFGMEGEKLPGGVCELGVLIPRAYVKNHLDEFGSELTELNKIFGVFQELATGQREPLVIRGISSSDLTVFLETSAGVAALVAVTLERIIALYKQLLEIRKLHGELAKAGVPAESTKGIEEWANGLMATKIDEAASEILKDHPVKDNGRSHELAVEIRSSMKLLANRIDRGFNINVRASLEGIPESAKKEGIAAHLATVQAKEASLTYVKVGGTPILSLQAAEDPKKPRR